MSGINNNNNNRKKSPLMGIVFSVLAVVIVFASAFYVLSEIKRKSDEALKSAPQEQFVGQAESSLQLQAACQKSAVEIAKVGDLKKAFAEYKRKADECREVYFSIEEQEGFRSEGMYPDLLIDLIQQAAGHDRVFAVEMLNYGKSIGNWQMYMGTLVCESTQVLAAFEESLQNTAQQKCTSLAAAQADLTAQLKLKNFEILSSYLPPAQTAALAAMEAGIGCPAKLSQIKSIATRAAAQASLAGEIKAEQQESRQLSLVFQENAEDDKLVLQFKMSGDCLQFETALVPGLQTNE